MRSFSSGEPLILFVSFRISIIRCSVQRRQSGHQRREHAAFRIVKMSGEESGIRTTIGIRPDLVGIAKG